MTDGVATQTFPDFWGFLQQCITRLDEEVAKVESEAQMKALVTRWLDPQGGVLEKLKADPFFAMAKQSAQRVFMDVMRNRVRQVEREWQEIWRSLYESEPVHDVGAGRP
jgi:hypothetical protein